jgi:hypothetical protein
MLILLAGLLTGSVGEPGSDWWQIATARTATPAARYFSDRASIIRDGDRVMITEAFEAEASRQPGVVSRRDRVEYDCRAGTYRMLSQWAAPANGRWRHIDRVEIVPAAVFPDSLRADQMRFACGDVDAARQLRRGNLRLRDGEEIGRQRDSDRRAP